jgi:hypothetical protein
MKRCPNTLVLDATVIDASGVLVPTDIGNGDLDSVPRGYDFSEIDSFRLPSQSARPAWVVKVVNDGDADVDVTPAVSTADDSALDDYALDGSTETAPSGSVPDNVAYFTGDTVAGHLGVELVADPAPTSGTVTVVFGGRVYTGV